MRLAGIEKGGYYPTPKRCVKLLSEILYVPRRSENWGNPTLRIIDPCCGPGDACETLATNLSEKTQAKIRTYGVELEKGRANQAREQMDFSLSSDIFQTYIANNAFHIMFLNPPYDFDKEEKRVEHAFLIHCTKYLEYDGLLVFVVPRHRLAVSARYLASHYQQLECWRFPDPEYDDFDQVMLLGKRKSAPLHIPMYEKRIQGWALGPLEQMKTLEDARPLMNVPHGDMEELFFTVRMVEPERAAEEAQRSGLWNNASIQQSLWPTEGGKTKPLMPLRQGHMAMLVAAGFLDNLQLETPEKRVLVKGKVTKTMVQTSKTEDEETWQERMQAMIRVLDLETGKVTEVRTQGRKAAQQQDRANAPEGEGNQA